MGNFSHPLALTFVFFMARALFCSAKDSNKRLNSDSFFEDVGSNLRGKGTLDGSFYDIESDVKSNSVGKMMQRKANRREVRQWLQRGQQQRDQQQQDRQRPDSQPRDQQQQDRHRPDSQQHDAQQQDRQRPDSQQRDAQQQDRQRRDSQRAKDAFARGRTGDATMDTADFASAVDKEIEKEQAVLQNSLQTKERTDENAIQGTEEAEELKEAKAGDFVALDPKANVHKEYRHEQHWFIPASAPSSLQ